MKTEEHDMVKIKSTKTVEMYKEDAGIWLVIHDRKKSESHNIMIPKGAVFQVKRGLVSYIQRFHRR
jgi:hypothetical protein